MSESNPYEAPKVESVAAAPAIDLPLATKMQRFVNYLVDQAVALALALALGVVLGIVSAFAEFDIESMNELVLNLITLFVWWLYYVVAESLTGRTIGKLVTGTKVVDHDGRAPSFGQILGRSLSRFAPFEPFSFLGGSSEGWHDRWSGTRVVRIR